MLDWIIKYWVQVVFGLFCAAIGWFAKEFIKMSKNEKQNHEEEIIEKLQAKIIEQYETTHQQMEECYKQVEEKINHLIERTNQADVKIDKKITAIKADILAIEGAYFRSECRKLLKPEHTITDEEFNTITVEHSAYNGLGGNHEGDALYEMIKEKHKNQLISQK